VNHHPCKAPGCAIEVGTDKLMCRSHWARVPVEIQRRVNHHWRRYNGAEFAADKIEALQNYRKATDDAIRAVAEESVRLMANG
jgi:hypothetical protein